MSVEHGHGRRELDNLSFPSLLMDQAPAFNQCIQRVMRDTFRYGECTRVRLMLWESPNLKEAPGYEIYSVCYSNRTYRDRRTSRSRGIGQPRFSKCHVARPRR